MNHIEWGMDDEDATWMEEAGEPADKIRDVGDVLEDIEADNSIEGLGWYLGEVGGYCDFGVGIGEKSAGEGLGVSGDFVVCHLVAGLGEVEGIET